MGMVGCVLPSKWRGCVPLIRRSCHPVMPVTEMQIRDCAEWATPLVCLLRLISEMPERRGNGYLRAGTPFRETLGCAF
ncbi:uncharacterized protein THITE_2108614 [Thermothielavioides terrestris NRRL 8126]|uniref:Uncharacterized protein n=1 Tax=Thermothielavioides terrestris (strain ATCC 38088 / NRRL 8126) TaxID=578455 RepID=G2QS16_THETT|nr:uncharacterized protein THITE_2108614 [Thermothielavioides terrestris NRRL 8126]AEO63406.1 hypothetical protein THITE_2108614 [Thermothielavioides terrestris NRRL 8126]